MQILDLIRRCPVCRQGTKNMQITIGIAIIVTCRACQHTFFYQASQASSDFYHMENAMLNAFAHPFQDG